MFATTNSKLGPFSTLKEFVLLMGEKLDKLEDEDLGDRMDHLFLVFGSAIESSSSLVSCSSWTFRVLEDEDDNNDTFEEEEEEDG